MKTESTALRRLCFGAAIGFLVSAIGRRSARRPAEMAAAYSTT